MIKQGQNFSGQLLVPTDDNKNKLVYFDYAIVGDYEKNEYQSIEGLHLNQATFGIKVFTEKIDFKVGDRVLLFGDNNIKIISGIGYLLTHNNYLGQKYKSNSYIMRKCPKVLTLD